MKASLAILSLALGACSSGMADTTKDYYGNVYPLDCPASIVSDPGLVSSIVVIRTHVAGTLGTARGTLVTLDPSLSGWILEDARRHEFCHVKHWLKDGNPDWHARYVPNVYRPPVCADPFHC